MPARFARMIAIYLKICQACHLNFSCTSRVAPIPVIIVDTQITTRELAVLINDINASRCVYSETQYTQRAHLCTDKTRDHVVFVPLYFRAKMSADVVNII